MHIDELTKDQRKNKLAALKQDHRDLDIQISELIEQNDYDQFNVSRLKRKKLHLKDAITRLESSLIPDLHA